MTQKKIQTFRVRWEERLIHEFEMEVNDADLPGDPNGDAEERLRDGFKDGVFNLEHDPNCAWVEDPNYWPAAQAKIELIDTRIEGEPVKTRMKRPEYLNVGDVVKMEDGGTFTITGVIDSGDKVTVRREPGNLSPLIFDRYEDVEVIGDEWSKEELDEVIEKNFQKRLGTFYSANGSFEVGAVEDYEGNMWRVWADGDTQPYKG